MEGITLTFIIYIVYIAVALKTQEDENIISPYECGFDPSVGSRLGFSYRFFLISILFLIFDVEISLILPLPYEHVDNNLGVWVMLFLLILIVGLVYEYYNGALSWVV